MEKKQTIRHRRKTLKVTALTTKRKRLSNRTTLCRLSNWTLTVVNWSLIKVRVVFLLSLGIVVSCTYRRCTYGRVFFDFLPPARR